MKTKFYTGKGDDGLVRFGKKPVPKDDLLFDVLGEIDELNAWVGFCRTESEMEILKKVQENLFIAQAEIAALGFEMRSKTKINRSKIIYLEKKIKEMDKVLPKLEKFVIPGGSEIGSRLDIARTKARKAERKLVRYLKNKNSFLIQYFNRLSSLFFALSRYVNYESGIKESNPKYK